MRDALTAIDGIKADLDTEGKVLNIEAKEGFDIAGTLSGLTEKVGYFEDFEIQAN